jgi:hypothetical protein
VDIEGCVPDCAQGSQTPTPVALTASDLVGGVYQVLTETIQGMPSQTYDAAEMARLNS